MFCRLHARVLHRSLQASWWPCVCTAPQWEQQYLSQGARRKSEEPTQSSQQLRGRACTLLADGRSRGPLTERPGGDEEQSAAGRWRLPLNTGRTLGDKGRLGRQLQSSRRWLWERLSGPFAHGGRRGVTGACPGVGLLDHKVARSGLSSGTSCFPQWLHQVPFPPIAHRVPFPPRPHPHASSVFFLVRAVLTGVVLFASP